MCEINKYIDFPVILYLLDSSSDRFHIGDCLDRPFHADVHHHADRQSRKRIVNREFAYNIIYYIIASAF